MRRRWWLALGGAGVAAIVVAAAAIDLTRPLDLSRSRERSTVVLDSGDRVLRAYTTSDGMWRLAATTDDVDPRYLAMLKAYEDQRFDWHPGVDPLAVLRAFGQMAAHGRVVSGASTLTMQAARLLEPRPRGWATKLSEARRALQLERALDKNGILAIYLTLAPFGGNLEGVRAASLAWFGKEPRRLTVGEAALLVALPQLPERLRPDRHPELARLARDKVLRLMAERGTISAAEAREAAEEAVPRRRLAMPFRAPHIADELRAAAEPGAAIRTTLDGRLQRQIEELARREAGFVDDGAGTAILAVENRGRQVRVWVGGTDYFGPQGQVDLARARRSPGSTLKPFLYALAIGEGWLHPETKLEDAPVRFGDYAPRNFDRGFQGTVSLRHALQMSLNVPAIAVLDRLGPGRFAATLREAGAQLDFGRAAAEAPSLPLVLGGVGISLADLTMLYTALGDAGRTRPLAILRDQPAPAAQPFLEAAASWHVIDMLSGAPKPEPWSQARALGARAIAYKTGTSYGFRDAWAVGVSPGWTVGVWIGRADGSARPGQYGRTAAAPLLFRVFDNLPAEDGTPRPPADALIASWAELPPLLKHFGRTGPDELRTARAAPRILFPPDGATIELERYRGQLDPLALKAEGGTGALSWVVNGIPLEAPLDRAEARWTPDGEGFARIVVIDATGRSARATVRVAGTE